MPLLAPVTSATLSFMSDIGCLVSWCFTQQFDTYRAELVLLGVP
jgi:hypothetical protein